MKVKDKKGNTVEEKVGQFTAARAKEFILRWADPGEHIRYDAPHSLVFLGEADENGFYCISYGGGARRNHDPNHTLQVEYRTYASIASKANGSLRIRDANNGAYRNGGSVKKWADESGEEEQEEQDHHPSELPGGSLRHAGRLCPRQRIRPLRAQLRHGDAGRRRHRFHA